RLELHRVVQRRSRGAAPPVRDRFSRRRERLDARIAAARQAAGRLHRARDAGGARARARPHGARRSRRRPHHNLVRFGAHRPRVQRRGAGADLLGAVRCQAMSDRAIRWLFLSSLAALAAWAVAHVDLSTDITRFMPTESGAELASLASRLSDSELTRTMILTV